MDALLFTATAAGLARWGLLPAWLAALIGLRYFLPLLGGLALMLALGHSLPLRHTAWGQRSTLAVGVALLLTWGRSLLPVPLWLTTGWYVLTLATMVLALGGIARRAPRGGAAPELQADPTRAQPHRV
jgi:phosphatidylglycerophosphate synthase